jgi:membrane fusion protein, multidrug efflux system
MSSHPEDQSGLVLLGLAPSSSVSSRRDIRKRRPGLRCGLFLLLTALFLAVAAAFEFGLFSRFSQTVRSYFMPATHATVSSRDAAAVRVQVSQVRAEDVPIRISGIGTVQAYNTINVTTRVDGQITQILFHEGQDVKAGDPLAIIDPRPYAAQLNQAKATLLKDQALLAQATSDLQRYETLEKSTSIAQQQAEDQRFLVMQDSAQVKLDEALVDYDQTQLEYTTIRAPIGGRLGIRQVDQGNIVYAALNTTIVVLTELRPISVIFTFPAGDVARAKLVPGETHVPVIAYAADNKTSLDRGTVDLVDNEVDPTTGNIKLRASFPNEELHLWPGDFVNGQVIVGVRHKGLVVPPTAIRHGPRGDFVWVVRDDNTAWAQGVRILQSEDDRILVTGNLKPGQKIVIEGHFLLQNGTRVGAVEPGPPANRLSREAEPTPEADDP